MPDGLALFRDDISGSGAPDFRAERAAARPEGVKRGLDLGTALLLLAVLAPLLLLLFVAVRLDGGAALFGHPRVGRGGRVFRCLKFRSMRPDADAALAELLRTDPGARAEWEATRKLRRDPRVTALGRFLRVSSLDELPQLFNVLRGEMSLVGPRPVTKDELSTFYGADARWYVQVRPGLTGPWQVSGRSATGYAERVRLDVDYVRNPSVRRDLALLGRTVGAVLKGRGAC
ncbi:sugar transferase [Pararoseomonas sp. SCSIO 73927]|uniref:sugar transferase n=1 Tax=Pararoseomonas sp. SCSIO 73927 TaxID=3114537 RepID=UPI0030CDB96A